MCCPGMLTIGIKSDLRTGKSLRKKGGKIMRQQKEKLIWSMVSSRFDCLVV